MRSTSPRSPTNTRSCWRRCPRWPPPPRRPHARPPRRARAAWGLASVAGAGRSRTLQAEVAVGRERVVGRTHRGLDRLELRDARRRPHDLHPAGVHAGLDAVDLAERVVAVLLLPQVAR